MKVKQKHTLILSKGFINLSLLTVIYIVLLFYGQNVSARAGAENLNKAISENLLPFKVREDIRMDQKNEKKSKKKSLTSI